jgi:hypothetical protein
MDQKYRPERNRSSADDEVFPREWLLLTTHAVSPGRESGFATVPMASQITPSLAIAARK